MYLDNLIGVTGKTLIAAFLIVNFFNIFPIQLSDYTWSILVSSLIVDSSSLLIIGICLLKFRNNFRIDSLQSIENKASQEKIDNEIKWSEKYKKLNKFISYFYIFLIIMQIPILINGINGIQYNYRIKDNALEKNYKEFKEKLTNQTTTSSSLPIEKINAFKKIEKQKDLKQVSIKNSKNSQLNALFKSILKIIILCIVWSYAFLRFSYN